MPWKNGAGWTSEILCEPAQGEWTWRLSIADIEADAPFSRFPGIERELVLLQGNGLRLAFEDGYAHTLHPPHDSLRFAGEQACTGVLLDGPTRDFNLMWRRGVVEARLWRRPLVGMMLLPVAPGETWVVHVLAGHARFAGSSAADALGGGGPGGHALAGCALAQADTAIVRTPGERTGCKLEGAGELLVIRISPCVGDVAPLA